MAKMYPAKISAETKSPGEIEIFQRLKNDPLTENWIVLHSLDIATHKSQISGELDFVVIVPSKGILSFEVKAAKSVKRSNGLWFYGQDKKGDSRGPFKQAANGMYSIRRMVFEKYPEYSGIVFWSAVIFPYIEFTIQSPEWHPWQVIDSNRFRSYSMGQNTLEIIDQARQFLLSANHAKWFNPNSGEPNDQQCKKIFEFLRPEFEYFESPLLRSTRRNDELRRYTSEQYEAIDCMVENPRVIFSGPAGTGKTLLAIEAARRYQEKGYKTLLICFNRLLGNWLKKETITLQPRLSTSTLHGFMLGVAGIKPPDNPNQLFWERGLPSIATRCLLNKTSNYQYDHIIIDEAQDILKEDYLNFLDICLKGGLDSGNWMMFGDFEKQSIYDSNQRIEYLIDKRFRHVAHFSLRVNCRNTPRVAELVHLLGGLNPGYTRVRRPDNYFEPRILIYKSGDDQLATLERVLINLQNERISPDEIVILSTKNEQDCIANKLSVGLKMQLSSLKDIENRKKISYGTVHSFKGLEAPVIILTDIEEVNTSIAASLFYVGITRSIDRLYILVNETARQELLRILTKT